MRNPGELYELRTILGDVPEHLPLIAALTGFADAGGAVSQLGSFVLGELDTSVIAVFDDDELLDYRARRPVIDFNQDHIEAYTPPKLRLYLSHDEMHRPFLFLHGYEPDFRWNGFVDALLGLVDHLRVASLTWIHSIPMPVPHTRPIRVTVSGNRRDLIDQLSVWRPRTQAPGTAMHLLEYRLQNSSKHLDTTGFIMLVPHYLADAEYPSAVLAALKSITSATGLIFPTDHLRHRESEFLANIEGQVNGNAELQRLVGTLEERHDSYMQENPTAPRPLADSVEHLPTADEIAAELETFLANQRRHDSGDTSGEASA